MTSKQGPSRPKGRPLVRQIKLEEIRIVVPSDLRENCASLTGYAFPSESAQTQVTTFIAITALITHYPGLRKIFLATSKLQGLSSMEISCIWMRKNTVETQDFAFALKLVLHALFETDLSGILEEVPIQTCFDTDPASPGLNVTERLLVAIESSLELSNALNLNTPDIDSKS
uniref:Uncharacterized protein n=1 Tax=Mycena chlorophos TaxID=658473 RepID=A0ABQ0LFQ0_MYCCL|nr:predicted protein [Mycena chlorophos]